MASPARTRLAGQWTPGAAAAIRTGTWQRACSRAADRARALASCVASPGRRAAAWNTYIASLLPYPSHVAMPSTAVTHAFASALRSALRVHTPWAPVWILTGLGPAFGIPGAPRCPTALARALAALGWIRRDTWGPKHLQPTSNTGGSASKTGHAPRSPPTYHAKRIAVLVQRSESFKPLRPTPFGPPGRPCAPSR